MKPSSSHSKTIEESQILHPHWDEPDREAMRDIMRARMSEERPAHHPSSTIHHPDPLCRYCLRELAPAERVICQHCSLQWSAWLRSEARWDRAERTAWIVLYVAAAIAGAILLASFLTGGGR